jgi:RNA polymerase sigma factor (sigma-70 family)
LTPIAHVSAGPYADRADEWLVERCTAADDDRAFAELVRRYRGPVFRLAVSILGQEFAPEAEDIAQDVMVRVHQSLRSFRGDAKVGSWIYRITFNQALNLKARTRYRSPHVSDDVLASRPSAERGPHDQLQENRRQRAVLACVHELPDVYQSALRLHYWLGASMTDIAVMLDAPENTVKSYLHRARRLLHAMLTERGFDAR